MVRGSRRKIVAMWDSGRRSWIATAGGRTYAGDTKQDLLGEIMGSAWAKDFYRSGAGVIELAFAAGEIALEERALSHAAVH